MNHSLSLGIWSKPGHISHPKRYLLLSLRANRDPLDSVDKARQILQNRYALLKWEVLKDETENPGYKDVFILILVSAMMT